MAQGTGVGAGEWGPVTAKPYQRYEFALVGTEGKTLHVYMEPFVRSDYDIRLLGSVPISNAVGNGRTDRAQACRENHQRLRI